MPTAFSTKSPLDGKKLDDVDATPTADIAKIVAAARAAQPAWAALGPAARAEIVPRLDRATALAGSSYQGLSIGCQRTRWASWPTTAGPLCGK